ncbi:unnamed protein product, partial [Schistosoma margrebowiei]
PSADHIIYQTERYHNEDFSYPIPITSDGEYILTLKFSEVWFTERYQKPFRLIKEIVIKESSVIKSRKITTLICSRSRRLER